MNQTTRKKEDEIQPLSSFCKTYSVSKKAIKNLISKANFPTIQLEGKPYVIMSEVNLWFKKALA